MHFYQLSSHIQKSTSLASNQNMSGREKEQQRPVSKCRYAHEFHSRMVIDITRKKKKKTHKNRFNSNVKSNKTIDNFRSVYLLSAVLIVFVLNYSTQKSHIAQKLHHISNEFTISFSSPTNLRRAIFFSLFSMLIQLNF